MDLPLPSTSARTFRPYRRRRILWTLFFLTIAAVYLLAPSSFWDMGSSQARKLAEAGKSWVPESLNKFNSGGESPYTNGEELQALLHMVASSELRIPPESDPSKPLARDVYSGGTENVAWLQQVQPDPPVIVFSKTYCPYSKKAKELLRSYDISPQPKIIEVDLRDDADQIKALLTRLTSHSTFPNIFISGKSVGGSDDLQAMHRNGDLTNALEAAGVSVNAQDVTPEKQEEKKTGISKDDD